MDNKQKILNALDILRIRDLSTADKFSAIAYAKAIKELKKLDSIDSLTDVEGIPGVGKRIKEKIQEILTTGSLEAATKAKADLKIDVYQDLLKIHGIGPAKAKELIDVHKIHSIADLRSKQELINDVQKMAKREPQGTMAIVENCGHIVNIEQAEEFNRLTLDWLRKR